MCPQCREEVISGHKCIRCGKDLSQTEEFVNPNFDMDKYNELAGHVDNSYQDTNEQVIEEFTVSDQSDKGIDDDEYEDNNVNGDAVHIE